MSEGPRSGEAREHLRPTRDPDLRVVRTHHSLDLVIIPLVCAIGAVVAAAFGEVRIAVVPGALLAFTLFVRVHHTVIDRRQRRFGSRFPWGPRALLAKHDFGPLGPTVHRVVKRSKGNVTVTFEVRANDAIVANGLAEADALALAREVRVFLESGETR